MLWLARGIITLDRAHVTVLICTRSNMMLGIACRVPPLTVRTHRQCNSTSRKQASRPWKSPSVHCPSSRSAPLPGPDRKPSTPHIAAEHLHRFRTDLRQDLYSRTPIRQMASENRCSRAHSIHKTACKPFLLTCTALCWQHAQQVRVAKQRTRGQTLCTEVARQEPLAWCFAASSYDFGRSPHLVVCKQKSRGFEQVQG